MLEATTYENRAGGMETNSSHNSEIDSWLAETLIDTIIRGVIRRTVLPVTNCSILSLNWKQT
jgi:hypothetical protein